MAKQKMVVKACGNSEEAGILDAKVEGELPMSLTRCGGKLQWRAHPLPGVLCIIDPGSCAGNQTRAFPPPLGIKEKEHIFLK